MEKKRSFSEKLLENGNFMKIIEYFMCWMRSECRNNNEYAL